MSRFLTNLLAVLGIVVAAAFVVAYFLAVFRRDADKVLRDQNTDLLARVDLLERDKEAQAKLIESQQRQIAMLQDMVTGTSAVADLRADLNHLLGQHERQAQERYVLLIESQDRVAEAIGKFTQVVANSDGRAKEHP